MQEQAPHSAWLQAPEQMPSLDPGRAPERALQLAPAWAPALALAWVPALVLSWVPELVPELAPEQAQGRAPEQVSPPQSTAPGSSAALRSWIRARSGAGCTGPGTAWGSHPEACVTEALFVNNSEAWILRQCNHVELLSMHAYGCLQHIV